jgi:hypothetical protein
MRSPASSSSATDARRSSIWERESTAPGRPAASPQERQHQRLSREVKPASRATCTGSPGRSWIPLAGRRWVTSVCCLQRSQLPCRTILTGARTRAISRTTRVRSGRAWSGIAAQPFHRSRRRACPDCAGGRHARLEARGDRAHGDRQVTPAPRGALARSPSGRNVGTGRSRAPARHARARVRRTARFGPVCQLDAAERRTGGPHVLFVDDADLCSDAECAVLAALHARRDLAFGLVVSARIRPPDWGARPDATVR